MAEVLCLGETMVMLVPQDARSIGADSRLVLRVGGAESNVALSLARLGHRAAWFGAVGQDPFGRIVLDELAGAGVEVAQVRTDPAAPTGLYLKDPNGASTAVHYYRRGSAASRLDAPDLNPEMGQDARVVHLSGTTSALSESCRRLTHAVLRDRVLGPAEVSFDVNYRPKLWSVGEAAEELAGLARRADIVFVGRDEAERLWGTATAQEVRKFLPEPTVLVVKDGAIEATSFVGADTFSEPARRVEVLETVGAGDAFAAGWLSAHLRGLSPNRALRLGHLIASRAVQIVGDCPPIPPRAELDVLLEDT